MKMGGNKGEAIVVMVAMMLAGGLVLWLATGRLHMMPMHGTNGMHGHMEGASPAGRAEKDSGAGPSVPEGERVAEPAASVVHGAWPADSVYRNDRKEGPGWTEEKPGETSGSGPEEKF